jgi:hypothetical protein
VIFTKFSNFFSRRDFYKNDSKPQLSQLALVKASRLDGRCEQAHSPSIFIVGNLGGLLGVYAACYIVTLTMFTMQN